MSPIAKVSRMLVGVDFDGASASALRLAGALAAAWDSEVTVFHSAQLEVPAYFTGAQIVALEAERERARAAIAARLRGFAEQHLGRAVHLVVEEGLPAETMLRMAESFDLIVVGTHRRHGARRWWLGSVAESVVRRSPRPVLVVPAGAALPDTRRPVTIRAAAGDAAEADAWVEALRVAGGGDVVRSLDVDHCTPDRLEECADPVLFVPSAGGIFQRSSS